ncbi:MAG: nucleotidyltransferase domain-containing protein [Theionarchaea archaeon]|nr:nucleotidyltransferase domain-containing protein [Theionarchaea archaeon]
MDREELIEEIKEFLKRIDAEQAILFGSRAANENLKRSDVNLVVIDDKFGTMKFVDRLVFLHKNWDLPYFLEGLPYTWKEFEQLEKTRGIIREAKRNGIIICQNYHRNK